MSIRLAFTLIPILALTACEEAKPNATAAAGPAAPINAPDSQLLAPPIGASATSPQGSGQARSTGTAGGGAAGGGATPNGAQLPPPPQGGAAPVPEPGTLILLGTGLVAATSLTRRRRRRRQG